MMAQIHVGDRVLVRLDPDLFGQIRILERAIAVPGLIFHHRSQTGIRVIAKSAGSDDTDFNNNNNNKIVYFSALGSVCTMAACLILFDYAHTYNGY
jgi:hypothetical protein